MHKILPGFAILVFLLILCSESRGQSVVPSNYYFRSETLRAVSSDRKDTIRHLNLHDSTIYRMPEWVAHCINLESLDISQTRIIQFPKWMKDLTKLERVIYNGGKKPLSPSSMIPVYEQGESLAPPRFSNLPQVKYLEMRFHAWESAPMSITKLKNLEKLILSDNALQQFPNQLKKLKKLKQLDLARNAIELPERWMSMPSLNKLDLRSNLIWKLPEGFERLPELRYLELGNNRLNVQDLNQGLKTTPPLRYLGLGQNELDSWPNVLNRMMTLEKLDLSQNGLKTLPEVGFGSLSNLVVLNLAFNQFQNGLEALEELPALKELDLDHNQLYELDFKVGKMRQLQTLVLSHNAFEYFPLTLFEVPQLKKCDLSFNRIANKPAQDWTKENDTYLWLLMKGNPIQGDQLQEFRAECAEMGVMLDY
ncbi:leucine-rich repeat domain-containing protein [Persicobacter diffluens]|uniref:Leucine-rich repeat domain-containing protein n=1 Tax=Persicobacter diffluens TaxID=981 RepID=A0AAN4VZP2_9BACT|nr:hypothetical protein PEDI_24450 [Persicobacter diffluens]